MCILGVPVHQVDMKSAVTRILNWIRDGEENYVCVRDVHGVMRAQSDPELLAIHKTAGLVTPDGMPLVWISRLRGSRTIRRVCGADLVDALCDASRNEHRRHFFYGGKPDVAMGMAERLKSKYPGMEVCGVCSPPFRALTVDEDAQVVDMIRKARADIVWVGISTPKQELWMRDHVKRLPGATLIGVGAAFDFFAGTARRAPRWMQRSGLEWFYRLTCEPKRLWARYIILAPMFVLLTLQESVRMAFVTEPSQTSKE